jgi:hypothetical protein
METIRDLSWQDASRRFLDVAQRVRGSSSPDDARRAVFGDPRTQVYVGIALGGLALLVWAVGG